MGLLDKLGHTEYRIMFMQRYKQDECPVAVKTKPKELQRHIVELDDDLNPSDLCLCGHIWDRVFLKHGESICQDCVDELKRRNNG